MSCGCSTSPVIISSNKVVQSYSEECDYTNELMIIWKNKLECIKNNQLFSEVGFSKYRINFAIGLVQSAINTGKPCYFKKHLDSVNDIILSLININKC